MRDRPAQWAPTGPSATTLRKAIKTNGDFPNEDAARKLIYLAVTNAVPAWTRTRNWTVARPSIQDPLRRPTARLIPPTAPTRSSDTPGGCLGVRLCLVRALSEPDIARLTAWLGSRFVGLRIAAGATVSTVPPHP